MDKTIHVSLERYFVLDAAVTLCHGCRASCAWVLDGQSAAPLQDEAKIVETLEETPASVSSSV